jgi:hypothetical protein
LHLIWHRTGDAPEEVWALPPGARAFRFASMLTVLEEEAERAARGG